jgi:hypothetical protein
VPDDRVTIDPEFRSSGPGDGQAHRFRAAGVAAVVVAAFALGWFLRSPAPTEAEPDAAIAAPDTTTTTGAGATAATSTTTRPPTTTTTSQPDTVGLAVSLGEAVPGFTDLITLERWGETGLDLVRWRPSQSEPETIRSFRDDMTSSFEGPDAAATWYALLDDKGILSVQRSQAADVAYGGWFSPDLRAVGVRVANSAWHDSEPGQLAWLACSRESGGPGTLFRLDVADVTAEPEAVRRVDGGCSEDSAVWLREWGDWGFSLAVFESETNRELLLDIDGNEIERAGEDPTDSWLVAGSPRGTIWAIEPREVHPSWVLMSLDGTSRTPVPGLAEGEWLDDAFWSPDGTRLALLLGASMDGEPFVRIVDALTGATLAEIAESGWNAALAAWSTDSRFLLLERWACLDGCDGWTPEEWALGLYDTLTDTTTVIDLPGPVGGWWGGVWLTDPTISAELIAHYPLDGDATDLTGYGHDAAVFGATPTSDRFGTPDAAYTFDGVHDFIDIEMRPQLSTDAVSITAWVKLPDPPTPRPVGRWRDIVSYGEGGHVLAVQSDGAVLGGLNGTAADCEFIGSDTVFDGNWHHVAMTRDANWTIRIYLDGISQTVTPTLAPTEADAEPHAACPVSPEFGNSIWIGADPGFREYFHGSIDDVRIYTGTLTDDEVAALAADTA